jgi:hypothetical protein
MNERIQLLAEQAEEWVCKNYPVAIDDNDEFHAQTMEKFAQLIVRECFEHCKGQLVDKKTADHMGLTYNDAVGDCANGLLQHFGVEE